MLAQSTLGGALGTGDVLVLSNGVKRILVQVPQTYQDLVKLSTRLLGIENATHIVFETDDLTICRGAAVEIDSSSWEAVRSVVGTVTVSTHGAVAKQIASIRQSLDGSARIAGTSKAEPKQSFGGAARTSSTTTLQSRQPSLPSSSLDDDLDNLPLEEEFDVEKDEENDENDYHPQVSPTKGKSRIRNRVVSDDEEEEEVQAQILRAPVSSGSSGKPSSRGPSNPLVPRVTPFSSPAPRASPAISGKVKGTPKDVRDIFSPSVKLVSRKARVPYAEEEEEEEEEEEHDENIAPPGSVRSPLSTKSGSSRTHQAAEDAILRSVKKTPQKSTNYSPLGDVSPSPKPKPKSQTPAFKRAHTPAQSSSLRRSLTQAEMQTMSIEPLMSLQPAAPPTLAPAPNDGKILITIAHLPSGQESKFKIKAKHIAGRVLTRACEAFGLDFDLAQLIVRVEEDGVEMTCDCKKDEPLEAAGVRHGSELFIKIDGEDE